MLEKFSPKTSEIVERYLREAAPGLACFDADGTLWAGDVGEAFLQRLIAEGVLPDVWGEYERIVAEDPGAAYAFAVRVMAGLREEDVYARARGFFAEYERNVFPAMRALVEGLQARGHDIWLVSGSNRWLIEASAERLGLSPKNVIAQEVAVEGGVLTDRDRLPTIFGPGKVVAIDARIGRRPAFAAGNSWSDAEMLDCATALRLLVNPTRLTRSERDLSSYGQERGWVVEER
jgi:HAD superfamily phosphoserine phosphatase-like hydrolase